MSDRTASWVRWGRAHPRLLLVSLVVLYWLAGKLGLHFAFVHASASAVWPPTGIALAALLLFGTRVWPAIALGAFLVNFGVAGAVGTSIAIATGNTLEAVVGADLVRRHAQGERAFDRARDFLRFTVLAGMASTAISATIGVGSIALTTPVADDVLASIWLTWWLGDFAGALVVAPVLLLWGTTPPGRLRQRPLEALLLLAVVLVTGALVFGYTRLSHYPLPFLCIPPLVWAAFRFGQREVASAVALLAAIATAATVRGMGPFSMGTENESLLVLQSFMVTIAALALPVAALVWERRAIEAERMRLLAAERAARADAEAANRAKDEFIAMLSHELRNPLAAITSAAQVLRAAPREDGFPARAAEIVLRQARHLGRLIEDLLDVARVTSGKIALTRQRVDLADLVRHSMADLRGAGRLEGHRVVLALEAAWTDGDLVRLRQVVDNLLVNAIKYTPDGGEIRIETRGRDDAAVLTVSDDGIGIATDLLPHVFELFTQGPRRLDRSQGGLGVGLNIAQRLVQAHGGRIEVTSDGAGRGASFTVRLPSARPPEDTGGRPPHAQAGGLSRRILIIEDDADNREALRMQLVNAGHEVFAAATGDEGLETAARVRPEIVLLDIGLPGLDGYEVAHRLRAAADGCPRLIAITGYGQPRDRERAMGAGIDEHVVKPVDADALSRLLA